jgi:chemotaxis protein MotC
MRARRFLIAIATLSLSWSSAAFGETGDRALVQMLADLQNLQTRIAQGDKAAYAAQPAALHDMAVAIASADPSVWKSADNVHAVVAYLLSGGAPRSVAPLTQVEGMSKSDGVLLRGALAYVVGREEEAQSLLGGLDATTLDLRLAGQIAFVQSVLLTSKDKKKAIQMLDFARLLAPGGLIEEAALRREILLAGETRDVDRFTTLSRQYISRFPKSIYAEAFLRSLAAMVARFGLAEDILDFHKLDGLIASLPAETQGGFFLVIARAALVGGKMEVADVAARMALLRTPAASSDEARGKLYGAAARMLTNEFDQSVAELNAIDASKLPKRDVALLAAARDTARRLRVEPPETSGGASRPPADPKSAKSGDDDAAMATIRLAEAAVARSDSLVNEKTK